MKKIFLILLMAVLIASCENSPKAPYTTITPLGDFNVKIIDGCEYIEYDNGVAEYRVYSLTHKGNCKNHKPQTGGYTSHQ